MKKLRLAIAALIVGCAATFAAPSTAAAPDTSIAAGRILSSYATNRCLAADYANIYTYGCSQANQTWYKSGSGDATYFVSIATGLCLANRDYNTVRMVNCQLSEPGLTWTIYPGDFGANWVKNNNTGRYLSTDFSDAVYLAPFVQNQRWRGLND